LSSNKDKHMIQITDTKGDTMPETDANMAATSSEAAEALDETVVDQTDAVEAADGQTDSGAKSSDAQEEEVERSTLDVIRDVAKADGEDGDDEEPEKASTAKEPEKAAESETDTGETDEENFSDVPFHEHPRFKQLLRQRDGYKAEAGEYKKITAFMEENQLTGQEAAEGFQIMAAMKSDPAKAWELLKPHVQAVLTAAGEVLPPELEQRVQAGELSREAALNWSRDRARVGSYEAQQAQLQQRMQREAVAQRASAVRDAAEQWQRGRQERDPRFGDKVELLQREVAFLQATEGRPDTPDGVRAQLQKAYGAVSSRMTVPAAPAQPAPVAKRPVTGSSVSSANARPEPQSTLDIIEQVEAASRAG
jgi:hypothetical protein